MISFRKTNSSPSSGPSPADIRRQTTPLADCTNRVINAPKLSSKNATKPFHTQVNLHKPQPVSQAPVVFDTSSSCKKIRTRSGEAVQRTGGYSTSRTNSEGLRTVRDMRLSATEGGNPFNTCRSLLRASPELRTSILSHKSSQHESFSRSHHEDDNIRFSRQLQGSSKHNFTGKERQYPKAAWQEPELSQQLQDLENKNFALSEEHFMLNQKLDEAYRQQHALENTIEEYEVNTKKCAEEMRNWQRKFQDLQKKIAALEKDKKDLVDKTNRLEADKVKLSEKWLRLSSRAKQEHGLKEKLRETEIARDKEAREKGDIEKKLGTLEKENAALKEVVENLRKQKHEEAQLRKRKDEETANTKQQSTLESEFKKALEMNRTLYEQNCRLNNETALVKEELASVHHSKDTADRQYDEI